MAPVVAVVKAVVAVVKIIAATKIGSALLYAAGSAIISRLIAKRAMSKATSGGDGGGRVQLPPASDNKLPVVYGKAYVNGVITDAKISTDNKTMWYVVSLAEHTDTTAGSGYSFGDIYYGGKLANMSGITVTSLTTNTTPPQTDTRVNGKINIYLYANGSSSTGIKNNFTDAVTVMSDVRIPVNDRWNSTLYTANGQSVQMTNTAFAIVVVDYNVDAGTTGLDSIQIELTNSLYQPGSVIKDYLLNERYGCDIPLSRIDTDSLTALNTYSNANITYTPVGGGSATQARYTIDGPIDTANDCLFNLQLLVDSCDSWLQYSELTGKWKVVINKEYTGALGNLFNVDSSNLVGGIDINPIDLNETYNQVEVAYPNSYIKDQTDYQTVTLTDPTTAWYDPSILSPNEPINRLNIQLPLVNNAVQAKYLGVRRLLQSREDLTISFNLDYSGIQLEAGDVIRVNHETYGWTDKLFRVSSVSETITEDNSLIASIVAFEYNGTIYNDNAIQDYVPAFNTGLIDPNVITIPGQPTASNNPETSGSVTSFKVTSAVPEQGSVLYMDFNYGNNSNVLTHELYRTVQGAGGVPFVNSTDIANNIVTNISVDINDLPADSYYFSVTARNDFTGQVSIASNVFVWPGAGFNPINEGNLDGVFSTGNILTSNNSIPNLVVGANVFITAGTGDLAANTYVTIINSTSPANFRVTPTPITPLSNANILLISGGINGNTITPNTLPGNRLTPNTVNGNVIIGNTVNGNVIIGNTVNGNVIIANTVNGNTIIANTVNGNTIIANTLRGNTIISNTVNGNTIIANTLNGNTVIANTINGNTVIANTLDGNTVIANTLRGNTIIANTLNGNTIIANTVDGDSIIANTLRGNRIIANTLDGNTIIANTVNGNTIIANTVNGNTIKANTLSGNTIIANTLDGNTIIANTIDGNTIIGNTINGNTIIANTLNGNRVIANTLNGNTIIANTLNGNSIVANTVNGNTIIANTLNGNTITANTLNGNTIISNTVNGNVIIGNTVNGNVIISNTINGNTVIANTLNGNSIQAFSINGGVAFIAGTIQAQAIAANTITFENLAIGAVTQSRSTISDPITKPIPFTNIPNVWPNNTRCVIPSGGVTIIPSTDPGSSANVEYVEGSRIQVSYSVKMYVDPGNVANASQNWDQYNLVEIWKSGASSVFDRGYNTIRQAYDVTGNATSASNQQLHALGYAPGGTDLYSDDGGNTWQIYNGNSTGKTITGAMSFTSTTFSSYPRFVESGCVGPLQTPDSGTLNSGLGSRVGSNAAPIIWDQDAGTNAVRYQTTSGGTITTGYQNDFLSMEFTPHTAGNGYPYTTTDAGYLFTGTNGDIFYSPTPFAPNENTTNAMRRENVPNLLKDLYASYSNPPQSNNYTAVIVGQTGTILRSARTIGASDFANSWTSKPTYLNSNTSTPLLTDLYSVAGDDTDNSPATSKWCAVGQYGMIQVSEDDGDSWTQVNIGANITCDFNGVRYGNGKWVAVGDGGNIYVSSNIANANAWSQISTSNLNYTNGTNYGSIYGTSNNSRQLNTVTYNGEWDTWNIGGQGIILYSDDNANTFQVAYEEGPSETYDLTRVTFFGSWPNVANVSRPPAEQRILNNQIFSGTILDTGYVAGQETTYYLVIGNMNGNIIQAGQIFLQVQEIKR